MKKENNKKFLLSELIKREFVKRYKRTALGQLWNVLSPLLLLLVMDTVYSYLFSRSANYSVFLFAGYIQFNFFSSATNSTLRVFQGNAHIFNKIRVNKLDFVIANNASNIITYFIMLAIFLVFMLLDGLRITPTTILLLYPMLCQIVMAYAVGTLIATIFVFFQDIKYIYPLLIRIMMYLSAIFYNPSILPENLQKLLWLSPIYPGIFFFREVALENKVPDLGVWLYLAVMSLASLGFALILLRKTEKKFYLYV